MQILHLKTADERFEAFERALLSYVPEFRWAMCLDSTKKNVLWSCGDSHLGAEGPAGVAAAFEEAGQGSKGDHLVISASLVQVLLRLPDGCLLAVCSQDVTRVGLVRSVVRRAAASLH